MPKVLDLLLLYEHLAHGPITEADQQAAAHICLGGAAIGLLIIIAGVLTASAWRIVIILAGGAIVTISLLGLGFFGVMGL